MIRSGSAARRSVLPGLFAVLALGSCEAGAPGPDEPQKPVPGVPALALPFKGHGNEPFWSIEIRPDSIVFQGLEIERVAYVTPAPEPVARGRRYSDASGFTVTVVDSISDDGMADMDYPNAVFVLSGGQEFRGCGGDPATLLTGPEWTVTAIDTVPVPAGSRVTIAFELGGRVSGDASCNRYSGEYTLHGEGMSFSPLAATEMACEPDRMAQESRFLEAMQKAAWFTIRENGVLELHGSDGRLLISARR